MCGLWANQVWGILVLAAKARALEAELKVKEQMRGADPLCCLPDGGLGPRATCFFLSFKGSVYLAALGPNIELLVVALWNLSSLTRDGTQVPLHCKGGILATGPPGKAPPAPLSTLSLILDSVSKCTQGLWPTTPAALSCQLPASGRPLHLPYLPVRVHQKENLTGQLSFSF